MMKRNLLFLVLMSMMVLVNAQDPVAQWRFENDITDVHGNSDGIVQPDGSTVQYDTDAMEGVASTTYDGNYWLSSSNSSITDGLSGITIAGWIKVDALPANPAGIFEQDGTIRTILLTDGRVQLVLGTSDFGWYSGVLESTSAVSVGAWTHVAFVWNGNDVAIYLNGVQDVTFAPVAGTLTTNGNFLLIASGAGHDSFDNLAGQLDDLRVYDRGLGATEVDELYNSYELDKEAPTTPANLTSSNITETGVDLSWDASTDNIAVAGYGILQDEVLIQSVEDGSTTVSVSGLLPGKQYTYGVYAYDASGNSSDTSEIVVNTTASSDTEPPTAPSNLMAPEVEFIRVGLMWDASTDNEGVVGYLIFANGVKVDSVDVTLHYVTGLEPGTTYEFTVKAVDLAGNVSDASNAVSATTLAPPAAVLVAQWPFNGDADNIVDDSEQFDGGVQPEGETVNYSGDAIDGSSSVEFYGGPEVGSYGFNCGEPDAAVDMEAFSVAFWMKSADAPLASGYQSVIGEESEHRVIIEKVDLDETADSTVIHFVISTTSSGWYGAGTVIKSVGLVTNDWMHVVAVYNGYKTYIYIDGVLDTENPDIITGTTVENGNGFVIGGQPTIMGFVGLVDDARFYTGAMDAAGVLELFDSYVVSVESIFDDDAEFNLFPNPTSSFIMLNDLQEKSRIQILTINGQTVYEDIAVDANKTIDVSNMSDGVYLISVESGNRKGTKRFVISR